MDLNKLISKLNESENRLKSNVFIGLDGFLDRIIRPVKKQNGNILQFYETITDFSNACADASGVSAQFELFTQESKFGGNAPIFAKALSELGENITCMGNFGSREIHPAFHEVDSSCKLISLGEPAETVALEFDDGKLILSELSPLKKLNWSLIKEKVGLNRLINNFASCKLIALVDWCNLVNGTEIWMGVLNDVVTELPAATRYFFFDLADPSKKSADDIKEILGIISSFRKFGSVIIGMNQNETVKIYKALVGKKDIDKVSSKLEEICHELFNLIDVDIMFSHPIDRCIVTTSKGETSIAGRLVKKPKISTGGGDNFNSGCCFGLLNDFSLEESAILGMSNSGAYVQNGFSPSKTDLIGYIKQWNNEIISNP